MNNPTPVAARTREEIERRMREITGPHDQMSDLDVAEYHWLKTQLAVLNRVELASAAAPSSAMQASLSQGDDGAGVLKPALHTTVAAPASAGAVKCQRYAVNGCAHPQFCKDRCYYAALPPAPESDGGKADTIAAIISDKARVGPDGRVSNTEDLADLILAALSPAPSPVTQDALEHLARIIDPQSWAAYDAPDNRFGKPVTSLVRADAILAVGYTLSPSPDAATFRAGVDAAARTWKCNCCQTTFVASEKEWGRFSACQRCAPNCPHCKAWNQYTYPTGIGGLVDKLEHYGFTCDGGPLAECNDWKLLINAIHALSPSVGQTGDGDVRERALCPQCQKPLCAVRQPENSWMNSDQWEAQRAGDYYCETCPDNGRGKSGKAYFWKSDLRTPDKVQARPGEDDAIKRWSASYDNLQARSIEQLTAERERAEKAERELSRVNGLVERMTEALKPFANEADEWPDYADGELRFEKNTDLTINHLRQARAALSSSVTAKGASDVL